jgi:hypothetical protein
MVTARRSVRCPTRQRANHPGFAEAAGSWPRPNRAASKSSTLDDGAFPASPVGSPRPSGAKPHTSPAAPKSAAVLCLFRIIIATLICPMIKAFSCGRGREHSDRLRPSAAMPSWAAAGDPRRHSTQSPANAQASHRRAGIATERSPRANPTPAAGCLSGRRRRKRTMLTMPAMGPANQRTVDPSTPPMDMARLIIPIRKIVKEFGVPLDNLSPSTSRRRRSRKGS